MATAADQLGVPWDELLGGGELDRVNLAFLGRAEQSARLARLVFLVLAGMTDNDGRPAYPQVVVLLPADVQDTVAADVEADAMQLRRIALDAEERDALSRRLQVQHLASFDSAEVLAAVSAVAPGSFVIVVAGARYRPANHTLIPSTFLKFPEDRWVPPLIELAEQCVEQGGEGTVVLVDVGEHLPALERNIQGLKNLDCTVWGSAEPNTVNDAQMARFEDWVRRVERGDILSVLGEVDALAGMSEPQKLLTKSQVLHKGDRAVRALEFLRAYLPYLGEAAADLRLKLATVALAGDDLDLAREFLESSADQLRELDLNELALELTQSIPSARIEVHCLTWLARYFPASVVLEEHQLRRLLLAARQGEPACPSAWPRLPLDDYVDAVMASLSAVPVPDYAELIMQVDTHWPARQAETRLAAALDARRRALPMHVAAIAPLIDPHSALARTAVQLLLWSIERLILNGGEQTREALAEPVLFVLLYLAVNPADTASRERLDELLSVDVAGTVGVTLLAYALLRLADDSQVPEPAPAAPPAEEDSVSAEEFIAFYHAAVDWLSRQRGIDLATVALPIHMLSLPADAVLDHLKRMAQYVIEKEQRDDGVTLRLMIIVAFAVAPYATRRNDDIEILRLATSRLVVGGEAQLARDLVEAGLAATHGRPERLRLAWYAYGDVFHRMHNGGRALLAFGCALATQGSVEPEQAYYETMGVIRALRDTGLVDPARQLLDRCERVLVGLGAQERMGHRIETVRLGLQLSELNAAASPDGEAWSALLREIDANLQVVMHLQDELATVLVMAVQVLNRVDDLGVEINQKVRDRIRQATDAAGDITAELVQLASNTPVGRDWLLARARMTQQARFSDDVGFDVQHVVRAARSQLSDSATLTDATMASFAAEMTTDHTISLHGETDGSWLPSTIEEPADSLQELSGRGLRVELLAFDSADRIVRVSADAGRLVVRREDSAFSLRALQAWSLRFPYEYGLDSCDPNLFYTSTRNFGLSSGVGDRAVFIFDTRLQRLPPQLLLIDGELLGREAAVAVAPSLTWLRAATALPRRHLGPPAAWISTAVEGEGNGTLATVAERLAGVLEQRRVTLETGAQMPECLKGAQLAIVAAHGGLDDGNRFFKMVSDEAQLQESTLTLARALGGAGVVVLFVCSGGRQEQHPVASTTVGLPKHLLDRGSAAVIASPWPLDSRVPSHWLPAFLDAWQAGAMLIDANAAGNRNVGAEMGNEPRDVLAMTLYGNPFLRRADLVVP